MSIDYTVNSLQLEIRETGHWTYPEQQKHADDWLIEKLKTQK